MGYELGNDYEVSPKTIRLEHFGAVRGLKKRIESNAIKCNQLHLDWNKWETDTQYNMLPMAINTLAGELKDNPGITSLSFAGTILFEDSVKALAELIKKNSQVVSLTVSPGKTLKKAESKNFCDIWKKVNASGIKSFTVWNSLLTDENLNAVSKDLETNRTLKSFKMEFPVNWVSSQKIHFQEATIQNLLQALKENSTLKSLTLKGVEITQEIIEMVDSPLKINETVFNSKRNDGLLKKKRRLSQEIKQLKILLSETEKSNGNKRKMGNKRVRAIFRIGQLKNELSAVKKKLENKRKAEETIFTLKKNQSQKQEQQFVSTGNAVQDLILYIKKNKPGFRLKLESL